MKEWNKNRIERIKQNKTVCDEASVPNKGIKPGGKEKGKIIIREDERKV